MQLRCVASMVLDGERPQEMAMPRSHATESQATPEKYGRM